MSVLSALIEPTALASKYTVFDWPEVWRFSISAAASLKKSVGTVGTPKEPSTTAASRRERMSDCWFGCTAAKVLWRIKEMEGCSV